MSTIVHQYTDSRKKCILVLDEDERPTQGFDDTSMTAEDKHSNCFTVKKICLNHYNGCNNSLFANGVEIFNLLKQKFKNKAISIVFMSNNFTVDNMNKKKKRKKKKERKKKTGLNDYVYAFYDSQIFIEKE